MNMWMCNHVHVSLFVQPFPPAPPASTLAPRQHTTNSVIEHWTRQGFRARLWGIPLLVVEGRLLELQLMVMAGTFRADQMRRASCRQSGQKGAGKAIRIGHGDICRSHAMVGLVRPLCIGEHAQAQWHAAQLCRHAPTQAIAMDLQLVEVRE
jgi:hypothetical protein